MNTQRIIKFIHEDGFPASISIACRNRTGINDKKIPVTALEDLFCGVDFVIAHSSMVNLMFGKYWVQARRYRRDLDDRQFSNKGYSGNPRVNRAVARPLQQSLVIDRYMRG